ncbi:MAG: hypothetical protein AAF696_27055 [Bacteroidota bacterium]
MKATHIIEAHSSHVNGVRYSRDGHTLFSFGFSGELKAWSTLDLSLHMEYQGHSKSVNGLLQTQKYLISGGLDGKLNFYEKGNPLPIRTLEDHKKGVSALRLSPDGSRMITTGEKRMLVLRDTEGEIIQEVKADAKRLSIKAISPDNAYCLLAGLGNKVRVFSLDDLAEIHSFELGQIAINGIRLSTDGSTAWALDYSGQLFKLNTSHWEIEQELALKRKGVYGICFDDKRSEVAITADKAVLMLDANKLEVKEILKIEAKGNYGLAYHPGGHQLALASADKRVRIWEL